MKKMPMCCCENCGDYPGCGKDTESPRDCGGFWWSEAAIARMPDKKIYVLTVNPMFERPILDGSKIHTIRKNYDFWKKRIESINRGEGILSIRVWTGKPRHSPQREIKKLENVGIQEVIKIGGIHGRTEGFDYQFFRSAGICDLVTISFDVLSANDGLSLEEFYNWFKDYPEGKMALIHFTNFRYE